MDNNPAANPGQGPADAPQPSPGNPHNNTPAPHRPPPGESFVGARSRGQRTDLAYKRTKSVPGAIGARQNSPPPFPPFAESTLTPQPVASTTTSQHSGTAGPSTSYSRAHCAPADSADSNDASDNQSGSTSVRVGRYIPTGTLAKVSDEQGIVSAIEDVCKAKQATLSREVKALSSKIDAIDDRRYHEERFQGPNPATEARIRDLENQLRALGKRPVEQVVQQPSAASQQAPKLLADANRNAPTGPFAHNASLAEELYAAQEQLAAKEKADLQATLQRSATRDDPPDPTTSKHSTRRRSDKRHDKYSRRSRRSRKQRKSRRRQAYSSSSCTSSSCSHSEHSFSSGESSSDDDLVIPFALRDKGPRAAHVHTLKTSTPEFERIMNYRYYSLLSRNAGRSSESTIAVHKHIKSLDITMKDYKFDGTDPVMVFDFLTRLTEEADTIGMTESQAFLALPHYLGGAAAEQFRASKHGGHSGGVTNWPAAVNYLLATYATPSAIRDATQAYRNLKQKAEESELAFSARVSQAAYRCGNVFDETDKMSTFVNGLQPTIRTLVARHRESVSAKRLTYTALAQYAKDEGEAYRARQPSLKPVRSARGDVLIMDTESPPTSRPSVSFESEPSASAATSSDTPPPVEGELQYLRQVPPAPLAFSDSNATATRPGWVQRLPLICYACYAKGHTSPKCELRAADMRQVVINFEALTDEEKESVPDTAYKAAKEYLVVQDRLKAEKQSVDSSPAIAAPSRETRPPPPSILRKPGSAPSSTPESKNA